jgi:adenylate cyclase
VILLVVAGGLAVMVQRSRRLVLRQVAAERARANLARYFSPNLVDALAESDTPLRATRSQEVAVLFVDMVGFTQMAAHATPEAVIALLRDLHRRMVAAVFLHGGTVEKYLGDGLMVTFGTPHAAADDAARTLACVRAMRGAIAAWNTERAGAGAPPIRIGIGAHHGPVVVGDLGDERHLERAVVGDTVNVASRLQELARSLDADVVVSDALVRRARAAGDAATDLVAYGAVELRGREERISVAVFASPA